MAAWQLIIKCVMQQTGLQRHCLGMWGCWCKRLKSSILLQQAHPVRLYHGWIDHMLGKGLAIAPNTPGSGILMVQSLRSLHDMINMATLHNGRDLVDMDSVLEGSSIKCIVLVAWQHLQH